MQYMLLIYTNESEMAARTPGDVVAMTQGYTEFTQGVVRSGTTAPAMRCSRRRRRRPCASGTARRSPRTGPSRRRRSSSADTTWSRPRTSTRRPRSPRVFPPRRAVTSRCGRCVSSPSNHEAPPVVTVGPHVVERVFREERGRILATLIRFLGDIDAAEEALAAAFEAALVQWPAEGPPDNPRAWLVRAARNKAIDRVRRERVAAGANAGARRAALEDDGAPPPGEDDAHVEDDRLRLIFTCCHPALAAEAQVALTLRDVGGLDDGRDRARFPGAGAPTMAQRIVRAKAQDPRRGHPVSRSRRRRPARAARRGAGVVYLVFNEGYAASSGDALVRRDLCAEAIRLGRLLVELLPAEPGASGLLALMLLHRRARADARRRRRATSCCSRTRTGASGTRRRSRRARAGRSGAARGRAGAYAHSGRDRRPARRGAAPPTPTGRRSRACIRLLVRPAPLAGGGAESRGGGGDGRRLTAGLSHHRSADRSGCLAGISLVACGERGPPAPAWPLW